MKNYKIIYLNIVGAQRSKTYFKKNEIDAINALLDFGSVKKILSIECMEEETTLFHNQQLTDAINNG